MSKIADLIRVFIAPSTGTASSPAAVVIEKQQERQMKAYLRVKIKSLAAESRIIRHAELHWRERGRHQLKNQKDSARAYTTFRGLQQHRHEIGQEARSALLAYGFLRGRAYRRIENKWNTLADWDRVQALIIKYGEGKYGSDKRSKVILWNELKVWGNLGLSPTPVPAA